MPLTYRGAKRRVAQKRMVGIAVVFIFGLITIISFLKFVYFGLDGLDALLAPLAFKIKNLVSVIHQKTQFLSLIWDNAPVPQRTDIFSLSNLLFVCSYLCAIIGASIFSSANQLAVRLRIIDREIEDELMRESVRRLPQRTREQIQDTAIVPSSSKWREIQTLYVAPLIVAIIGGLVVGVAIELIKPFLSK